MDKTYHAQFEFGSWYLIVIDADGCTNRYCCRDFADVMEQASIKAGVPVRIPLFT